MRQELTRLLVLVTVGVLGACDKDTAGHSQSKNKGDSHSAVDAGSEEPSPGDGQQASSGEHADSDAQTDAGRAGEAGKLDAGVSLKPGDHDRPKPTAPDVGKDAGTQAAPTTPEQTTDAAVGGSGGAGGSDAGAPTSEPDAGAAGGAGGAGGAGAGGAGGQAAATCFGPTPSKDAWNAKPTAFDMPSAARKQPGAEMPRYWLTDFQPLSCGYGATYGLDTFVGRPTMVALFASWCPYCQANVEQMQRMQLELEAAGKPVYMVVVNASPAQSGQHDPIGDQWELVRRVTFPLLQDTNEVDAWSLHSGDKDDLYIYGSDGKLVKNLNNYDSVTDNIDLTTDEGYAYVKGIVEGAR